MAGLFLLVHILSKLLNSKFNKYLPAGWIHQHDLYASYFHQWQTSSNDSERVAH